MIPKGLFFTGAHCSVLFGLDNTAGCQRGMMLFDIRNCHTLHLLNVPCARSSPVCVDSCTRGLSSELTWRCAPKHTEHQPAQ